MKLTLVKKEAVTADAVTFTFQLEEPVKWRAGQYLHYTLPHPDADDRGAERWFTISSAPHEEVICITTRLAGPGGSTFKRALQAIEIGQEITAGDPEGDFTVTDPSKRFLFVAGGIGITPFRSIIKDLDHRGQKINAVLMYSNSTDDYAFKSELEEVKSRHPEFGIHYYTGSDRIDGPALDRELAARPDADVYISGPEPMVEAMESILQERRFPKNRLHTDFFPGYTWEDQPGAEKR